MTINNFLMLLEELVQTIDGTTETIYNKRSVDITYLGSFFACLDKVVPPWIEFIEINHIGDADDINIMLNDIEDGISRADIVFLTDVMLNGLQDYAKQFIAMLEGEHNDELL